MPGLQRARDHLRRLGDVEAARGLRHPPQHDIRQLHVVAQTRIRGVATRRCAASDDSVSRNMPENCAPYPGISGRRACAHRHRDRDRSGARRSPRPRRRAARRPTRRHPHRRRREHRLRHPGLPRRGCAGAHPDDRAGVPRRSAIAASATGPGSHLGWRALLQRPAQRQPPRDRRARGRRHLQRRHHPERRRAAPAGRIAPGGRHPRIDGPRRLHHCGQVFARADIAARMSTPEPVARCARGRPAHPRRRRRPSTPSTA